MNLSIILPTYNEQESINALIAEIYELLELHPYTYEIIVVDDGSTDNTARVLARYDGRIKHIVQENKGISGARNRGIQESTGEYLAFLDSDDVWFPIRQ